MAQLSFEHYEKMTDATLSLEGKANYLSPIIQRNNLSTPLPVLPLLAGWDLSYRVGRIFEYDGAGGATSVSTSRPSGRVRPSPKTPCAWAFAATWTRRVRSTWARWRSTRPATTTRRPGGRTSCATSSR